MKKNLIIAAVIAVSAVSSFAQGFINFQGYVGEVKNNYTTPGTLVNTAGLYVQLFYATGNNVALNVASVAASTAATTPSLTYNTATAWSSITGDSNFHAVEGVSSAPTAFSTTTGTGGFTYNSSAAYQANNLPVGAYTFYMVAWYAGVSGTDNTIALASAAGDYVGWSKAFNYTTTVSASPPPATMNSALIPAFFVGGSIAPTPEPGTMALAALGGASLLLFRRRK
jgi:hypothetical protein